MNVYNVGITPEDNMLIEMTQFQTLPANLREKMAQLTPKQIEDYLIIESDTLEIGKDLILEFSYKKEESALVIRIKALKTLKGHYLNISPKYFHFLPLAEILEVGNSSGLTLGNSRLLVQSTEDIYSDPERFNEFIKSLKEVYTKEEIESILGFKLSKSFKPVPINLA